ncbi:MAG: hypothetical protein SNJ82_11230 [Gemmataceae bacterium]
MDRRLFLLALGCVGSGLAALTASAWAAPLPSTVRVDRPLFEAETAEQAHETIKRIGSPAFAQRVIFLVPDLVARLPQGVDRLQWVRERLKAQTQGTTGVQVRVVNCDGEQIRLLAGAVSRVLTTSVSPSERSLLSKLQDGSQNAGVNPGVRRKMVPVPVANAPAAAMGAEEQEQLQQLNSSMQMEFNARPLRRVR